MPRRHDFLRRKMRRSLVERSGVTIIEVMASAVLIFLGLGAIFSLNTQSLQILRRTRQYAAASQVLQERLEMLRSEPWPEVARAQSLAMLYQTPAISSADLADAQPREEIVATVPDMPGAPATNAPIFEVRRLHGRTLVVRDADLSSEPILLFTAEISWRDGSQTASRTIRTVVARNGLTRAGISGSIIGRPQTTSGVTP